MIAENDLKLLHQVLTARSIPATPEFFEREDMLTLFNDLVFIRKILIQFSRGNIDTEITGHNVFVGALKTLQANLRHLVWQVKQVAQGDFSHRVDFMGAFSDAFNSMVQQLERSITELKDNEARLLTLAADLRSSEERWNLAVQCSRDGIWDINIDDRTAWYSDNFMQMMHYTPDDLPHDLRWETMVHPDDHRKAKEVFHMLQGTGTLAPFVAECRFQNGQNRKNYLWLRIRGMPANTENVRRLIVVASDITDPKETEIELTRQAMHDSLTGLPNRYLLDDRLQRAAANTKRDGKPFVFVLFDLDFFKGVNDTYGHAAGDLVLQEFAKRLCIGLRRADTTARLGGDEFVGVYPCAEGLEQVTAEQVMRRFYELLKPTVTLGNAEYPLRASAGIAFFPKHTHDLPTLFECADVALYQAKESGKNQYTIYEPGDKPISE